MVVKSVSLVELKKQQWAKEKEELGRLNSYWKNQNIPTAVVFNDQRDQFFYPEIRSNDKDRLDTNKDIQSQNNLSFPPISNDNQKQNKNNNIYSHKIENDQNNDVHNGVMDDFKKKNTHTILNRTYTISKENNANERGSLERQMWDKQYNTGVNSLNYNSNEKNYSVIDNNEIPTWVESTSEKPCTINDIGKTQLEDYGRKIKDFKGSCETLSSLDSNCVNNRTYLLGQNIPLTTDELAARELKRQKAMELQEAIKQQLKERQLKKKHELEKKKQDDLAEERQIQRQQEVEKKTNRR